MKQFFSELCKYFISKNELVLSCTNVGLFQFLKIIDDIYITTRHYIGMGCSSKCHEHKICFITVAQDASIITIAFLNLKSKLGLRNRAFGTLYQICN